MKKGFVLALAVLFFWVMAVSRLQAEAAPEEFFSLHLIPLMQIPLGDEANYFTLGGGASLLARLSIPGFQYLYFEAGADYGISPVKVAPGEPYTNPMLNVFAGRLGAGLRYPVLANLFAGVNAHGGYYYGFMNVTTPNGTASNPMFDAGVELKYRLTPVLSLGVDASYRWLFGLSNSLLVGIGASYSFPVAQKGTTLTPRQKPYPGLELLNASFPGVFPVFYKYYADHPIGTIVVANTRKIPLEKVQVRVFVNQFMDNPYLCKEIPFITGGGKETVDLFALFNDKVLGITEATKVQINIAVESKVAGDDYGNEMVENLRIHDRNAMTWEDDRRAAAFVGLKDPSVLKFSKNVTSYIRGKAGTGINRNFLTALALFEALRLHGMSYAVDPTSPFTEMSKQKTSVDYLQFPNQTLDYKAGDCDDLSILYCSLLESVGIKSAFLTTPGHIFAAVSLDAAPAEARRQFAISDDLIVRGEETWLPVEITALSHGFLEAWRLGASLWKEQEQKAQARMIVLRDAWQIYEPVGFTGETRALVM
ncbi:MAG TPA: hypothetical protein VMV03_03270, partial [Spirochaetia bacterium]|nr:hypothetical protein [Spirochaetia bacterium]